MLLPYFDCYFWRTRKKSDPEENLYFFAVANDKIIGNLLFGGVDIVNGIIRLHHFQ